MMTRLVVRLRAARSQHAGTTTALMREFCGLDARFATFAGGSPGVSGMSWSSMRRARKCVAALDELLVCVVGLFEVVLRRDRAVVFGAE